MIINQVKISTKIQIISNKNNKIVVDEYPLPEIIDYQESDYKIIDENLYVSTRNNSSFSDYILVHSFDTINIILLGTKLYTYHLYETHYIIFEYGMFYIRNTTIIDEDFFVLQNIVTPEESYSIPKKMIVELYYDECIFIYNQLLHTQSSKIQVKDNIINLKVTENMILTVSEDKKSNHTVRLYTYNLEMIFEARINKKHLIFYNSNDGFILSDQNEAIYFCKINEKYYSKKIKLTNKPISRTCKIEFGFYHFFNSKIVFFYRQNNNLIISDNLFLEKMKCDFKKNNEKLFFEGFIDFDSFENDFIILSKKFIYLFHKNKLEKYENLTKNSFKINLENLSLQFYEKNSIKTKFLFKILIESKEKIDFIKRLIKNKEFILQLEVMAYNNLLKGKNEEFNSLLIRYSVELEDLICNLFRKGDEVIKKKLLESLKDKYFLQLKKTENIHKVFSLVNINYRSYIINAILESKENLIIDTANYCLKNKLYNDFETIVIEILRNGNVNILLNLKLVDKEEIDKFENLKTICYFKNFGS